MLCQQLSHRSLEFFLPTLEVFLLFVLEEIFHSVIHRLECYFGPMIPMVIQISISTAFAFSSGRRHDQDGLSSGLKNSNMRKIWFSGIMLDEKERAAEALGGLPTTVNLHSNRQT